MIRWGWPPSEFWAMSPQEFWRIASWHSRPKKVGDLTMEEFEELREMLH